MRFIYTQKFPDQSRR